MKQRHHLDRTTPVPAFVSRLELNSDSCDSHCDCGASLFSNSASISSSANGSVSSSSISKKSAPRISNPISKGKKKILKPNFVPTTIPEKMGLTYKVEKHSADGSSSSRSVSTRGNTSLKSSWQQERQD